jgi:hypothetical protein
VDDGPEADQKGQGPIFGATSSPVRLVRRPRHVGRAGAGRGRGSADGTVSGHDVGVDRLDDLLAQAETADGLTRIEYRDPIARFGSVAVERLQPWLLDARLGRFAVLAIARAGTQFEARAEAIAALRGAKERCPSEVRPTLIDALNSIAGVAHRAPRASRPPRTSGGVPSPSGPMPQAVAAVVNAWISAGRPSQPARDWHCDQWRAEFPAHESLFLALPRKIDRDAVRPHCTNAASSSVAAETSLIATMAWGAIDFGYRCKWTKDMLATPGARERLMAAAQTLASDGAVAAYRRLHHTGDCHIDRLGESFASKWLYFCQPEGDAPRALILDSYVNDWLDAETGLSFSSGRGSAAGYASYLAAMHTWAAELNVRPEEVELCIFRAEAGRRGSGWGD